MIYVTHDQVEAMTLADKIVVMNLGRIEQVGSPRELYETPANTFVATFIGSPKMTLVDVSREGNRLGIAGGGSVALDHLPDTAQRVKLGMRPDALTIMGKAGEGFAASVVYTEYLGDDAYVYARFADGTLVAVRTHPNQFYEPDGAVWIGLNGNPVHFFDADSGQRLSH
jgi:lactose/L-arabinose transport system ATP-binding protein